MAKELAQYEIVIEVAADGTKTLRMWGKWLDPASVEASEGSVAKSDPTYDGKLTGDQLTAYAVEQLESVLGISK